MCHKSHQTTHLLFKYYVSKLGGDEGSMLALTMLTQGRFIQNLGHLADVILEHSLMLC